MAGAEMDFPKLRPGSDVYLIEDRETELPIPTWMADAELDFSKPWPGSDVTFLIEGKKVYANKLILSMWSPVMEAMFTSEFKEKDTAEIPLPQKNYIDFLQLMKAVHPPNTQITAYNVYKVLPLSSEYQMRVLLGRCESYLLSCPPSMRSLVLSDQYSLPALRSACIQYAKDTPISALRREAQFNEVVPATLIDILTYKVDRDEHYLPKQARFRPVMGKISAKLNNVIASLNMCCYSNGIKYTQHNEGENEDCPFCTKLNLSTITKAFKEFAPTW